jgi:hypothetical protein
MMWLVTGFVMGVCFTLFTQWVNAKRVHTGILFWLLTSLALLALLTGMQNFVGLRSELEEQAAWRIIPIYAVQVLVFALPAVWLLRRNAKKAHA